MPGYTSGTLKCAKNLVRLSGCGVLIALAACGPFAGRAAPTPTPTVVLGPLPPSILLPPGSAAPFAVQGNEIVWAGIPSEHGICPRYHLYMANLRAYHPATFWVGPRCVVISDVRISPRWIAWVGGVAPAGVIWVMDRSTGRIREEAGQVYRIVNHPCPTAGCVPPVAISLEGGTLVWSHFIFGPKGDVISSAIRARSLPNGRPRTLYQTVGHCEMQIDPQLSNGRLVWLLARWPRDVSVATVPPRQCEGPLQTDVITKLIGRRPHVISGDGGAKNPQTNGRYLSWQDAAAAPPSCVCTGLWILDTRTGRRLLVSPEIVDAQMTSEMTSDLLAWLSSSQGATRVEAYSLGQPLPATTTGLAPLIQQLAVGGSPASSSFVRKLGWGWNRRIVWEQDVVSPALSVRVGIQDVG